MTQTVPATCVLGPGKTGLTIGYRVLNLDGTEYSAFTTTGVAETAIAGTYRQAGGVVAPAAGGYIVWGVSGTDLAEATVESIQSIRDAMMLAPSAGAAEAGSVDALLGDASIDPQALRDAMLLAPTPPGTAAAGSVDAKLDDIVEDTGTTLPGLLAALSELDLDTALEGTVTLGEALRVMLAALAGVSSGGGTATVRFKSIDEGTDRIVATVDGQGNRSAVALDGAE